MLQKFNPLVLQKGSEALQLEFPFKLTQGVGGMGAVAPNPLYNDIIQQDFEDNILAPTLRGLKERQLLFSGVIFLD